MIVDNFDFKGNSADAREKAITMVENGLYSRFNLSNEERIEKAYLGCLGEYAFQQFLENLEIGYELDEGSFENRNSDEFDFLISDKKIDVKVAKKTTSSSPSDRWTYGYPQEQNPTSKDYVVVGWVDFNNEEVGFYGWITGKEIASFPVVERNSYAGYKYLTPNHEFEWGKLNKDFGELFRKIK